MKKVINTDGYGTTEGSVLQVTLPNGKYFYTGINSLIAAIAERRGLDSKVVQYFGACNYFNINERAHEGYPIQIDEVSVTEFIEKISTGKEFSNFSK